MVAFVEFFLQYAVDGRRHWMGSWLLLLLHESVELSPRLDVSTGRTEQFSDGFC